MANETGDFLAALAMRSGLAVGGQPPAVRPRLPARFEPLAPAAGAWLPVIAGEAEAPGEARRTARAAPPAAPDRGAAPAASIRSATAEAPALADALALPALRVIERWTSERETRTIRVVERDAARPSPAPPTPQRATSPAEPREVARALPPMGGPRRMTKPAPPMPAARPPSPARPPLPAQAPHQPALPAEPDVHITIGRIDVRATPAPAQGRPAARPSGPSLDRYLESLGSAGGGGER